MRTLLRHRSELVQAAAQHVQHMHKSLTQMNLQIHHVISDITGSNRARDCRRHSGWRTGPG